MTRRRMTAHHPAPAVVVQGFATSNTSVHPRFHERRNRSARSQARSAQSTTERGLQNRARQVLGRATAPKARHPWPVTSLLVLFPEIGSDHLPCTTDNVPAMSTVALTHDDHVAVIELNRPDALN